MHAPAGLNPLDLLAFIGSNLTDVSPAAAALALGTSAAMYALPKIHPKIPSALLAVGGATAATHTLGLDVTLIGTIPSGLEAFQMAMPVMPPLEAWPSLTGTILLIYAMTSVESLLSCAALDKMKKTSMKYNADQELIGQGLANMGSAMFMGMPVTSVIARSGLNVRLNASTRLPALVQAGFVFSSVVFFSQSIAMIPMPALSGMLITTGMGMLYPAEFKHCYAVQKIDVVPFATTIAGMITFGLAEGIGLGCVSAVALSYLQAHTAEHARLHVFEEVPDFISLPTTSSTTGTDSHPPVGVARGFHQGTPNGTNSRSSSASLPPAVWQLHGPVNFLSMFEIDDLVKRIERRHKDQEESGIVLDMRNVTQLEFTGVEELVTRVLELEAPVTMTNCNEDIINALDQCDPRQQITREMIFVDAEFTEKEE
jgi:SulP family sulfate permease